MRFLKTRYFPYLTLLVLFIIVIVIIVIIIVYFTTDLFFKGVQLIAVGARSQVLLIAFIRHVLIVTYTVTPHR